MVSAATRSRGRWREHCPLVSMLLGGASGLHSISIYLFCKLPLSSTGRTIDISSPVEPELLLQRSLFEKIWDTHEHQQINQWNNARLRNFLFYISHPISLLPLVELNCQDLIPQSTKQKQESKEQQREKETEPWQQERTDANASLMMSAFLLPNGPRRNAPPLVYWPWGQLNFRATCKIKLRWRSPLCF